MVLLAGISTPIDKNIIILRLHFPLTISLKMVTGKCDRNLSIYL